MALGILGALYLMILVLRGTVFTQGFFNVQLGDNQRHEANKRNEGEVCVIVEFGTNLFFVHIGYGEALCQLRKRAIRIKTFNRTLRFGGFLIR